MRQTHKTLMALVAMMVVVGGLGLYAWQAVHEGDRRQAERKELTDRIFAFQDEVLRGPDGGLVTPTFTRLTLVARGETTVLERRGNDWVMTAPASARTDKVAVDGLLSQLQTAKIRKAVEDAPSPEALAKYGLDAPSFVLKAEAYLAAPGAARTIALFGGGENPFDGSVYLRREGEPRVFTAEGGFRWAVEKSSFELREKAVLTIDEPKLRALEVKGKKSSYRLERVDAKTWRMAQPSPGAVDGVTVTTLLASLKNARALTFQPVDTAHASAAEVEATFELESGQVRLRLLRPRSDAGEQVLAWYDDGAGPTLAEVTATLIGVLDRDLAEFRDRSVVAFKREAVDRVVFSTADGKEVTIEKIWADAGAGDERWQVVSPVVRPAKKWKVSSVLWGLSALRIAVFGEERPRDWSRYGITPKSRWVRLYGKDGAELGRLVVGTEVPDKTDTFYVRGTKDQVFEVDATRLGDLPTSLADVVDAPDAGP